MEVGEAMDEQRDMASAPAPLAKTLASAWPRPSANSLPEVAVAGAATLALKRLGEEALQVQDAARRDEIDPFLAVFAQLIARARALEPVATQLRPRWGDASAHGRMFQWCREVAFTAWATACPQALRAAAAAQPGSLPALDVSAIRTHWATVRTALAAMAPVDPRDFHAAMEAELSGLRGAAAPQRVAPRDRIPPQHQSRAMGKGEAAKLHAGVAVPDADAYFERLIAQGVVTAPIGGGRQWRFDVREFPASKRDQMR